MKRYLQKHFENVEFQEGDEVIIIYTGTKEAVVRVKFDKEGKPYYKNPNPQWTTTDLHIFRNGENICWKVSKSGVVYELMQRMKHSFKNDLEVKMSDLEKKYFTDTDYSVFCFGFHDQLQKEDKEMRVKAMKNMIAWGKENMY